MSHKAWAQGFGVCWQHTVFIYITRYPGFGGEEKQLCIHGRLSPSLADSQIVSLVFILPFAPLLLVTISRDH